MGSVTVICERDLSGVNFLVILMVVGAKVGGVATYGRMIHVPVERGIVL